MDSTREAEARFAEGGDRSEASRVLEPVHDQSLDRVWDRIVELARPSARLVRASSAYGSSRLGGLPMVDPNFSWPADPDGQPLPFVGQIDFADVSRVCSDDILPTDGLIALFYDSTQQPSGYQPTHRGRWALRYSKSPSSLASPPDGANINIPEIQMTAVGDLTLPESDSIEIENLGLSPDETDAYESVLDHLKGLHGAGVHRTIHRVVGWPDAIQHDPASLAQLASIGFDAGDPATYQSEPARSLLEDRHAWRLLAQIDSEDSIGLLWGLYGRIYFMMKELDLRQRIWEAAWVVLQWS